MLRKLLVLLLCIGLSIVIVIVFPHSRRSLPSYSDRAAGIFSQHVLSVSFQPETVYTLYQNGTPIGTVLNIDKIKEHMKKVYHERYEQDFPSSSLHLTAGLSLIREETVFNWSDSDEEIIDWLDNHDAYALQATEIAFANSDGIYARIYVENFSLYENALKKYLSFFVQPAYLDALLKGESVSDPTDYGSADTGLAMSETVTTRQADALPSAIYTTEEQVLEYLEYGGNTAKNYYTVQPGDTLAGIGAINGGLSPSQLVNINQNVLHDVNDPLTPGEKLCVTYFESPITIQVYRTRLVQENIPYKTDYVDQISDHGGESIMQKGTDGTRNCLYKETWVNGVLSGSELVSSLESNKAVNQVKAIDNEEEKAEGTGSWQLPVDHARISCQWGCRLNEESVSYQNAYNLWGNVYAADNGKVIAAGYDEENGNYIRIDHENGYISCYAHLQEPADGEIGKTVQKGDVIGQIGITGNTEYPHLKFWIEDGTGAHLNPQILEGFPKCPN